VTDRLTDRGGAYWHLLGILIRQARSHEVQLVCGRDDRQIDPPCPVTVIPGLDARTAEPVEIDSVVASFRPDVVHVHNVVNPEGLRRIGQVGGVGRVITVQDHRFFCPGRGKWTAVGHVCDEAMSRELCAQCFTDEAYFDEVLELTRSRREALARYRIVVLSRYMRRELEAVGVSSERTHVIPPFVHGLDFDAAPDGPPCILFAGRLVAAKGVRDAVAAWKRSGVELPLVMAGTGTLREKLSQAHVLGWVPHHLMSALYRRAAAVVMPSRWQEPFGIVGLEARSMGAPVAAWDSGGVSEWHPEPGLVRWGDVNGLAHEISQALERRVEPPTDFEPEALMERLHAVYAAGNP